MTTSTQKIVFTGGGTGGHVTPALAIAEGLRAEYPNSRMYYVGLRGKAEDGMVQKAWATHIEQGKASLHFVSTTSGSLKSPKVLWKLGVGFLQASLFLLRHKPDVVVATGGYVSAPIVFATGILRKLKLLSTKIFLHEANAELGKMNQMAVRFADKVGFSFPGTQIPTAKKAFVGYPVRSTVISTEETNKDEDRKQAREKLGFPENAKIIFAFGGSQGARTINRGVVAALPILLADPLVYVVHGTGRQLKGNAYNGMADVKKAVDAVKNSLPVDWEQRYLPTDFIYNMGDYYAATDVVVCRGGAGSLVEVCAKGVASIAIPKANLPGDHQAVNARVLEKLGATTVLYERVDVTAGQSVESINTEEFAELVFSLLADGNKRASLIEKARKQYDAQTTKNCALVVKYLLGDGDMPKLKEEPVPEKEIVLGTNSVQLEKILQQYRHGKIDLSEEDKRLALYKIDGWLAEGGFVMPARASRMIGIGRFEERRDILLHVALDKKQSPFTRRDAFVGLEKLGILDEVVIRTCLQGSTDGYFEAVNQAVYCLGRLLKKVAYPLSTSVYSSMKKDIQAAITPLAKSREFDIRMNALMVLAVIADNFTEIESVFSNNYFHPNWQVRKEIISCFDMLLQRNVLTLDEVQHILSTQFLQTSNGFNMHFQLKQEILHLFQQEPRKILEKDINSLIFSTDDVSQKQVKLEQIQEYAQKKKINLSVEDMLQNLRLSGGGEEEKSK